MQHPVHPGSLVLFIFHYLLGSGSSRLPALTESLRNRDTLSARLDFHTAQTLTDFFPFSLNSCYVTGSAPRNSMKLHLTASLSPVCIPVMSCRKICRQARELHTGDTWVHSLVLIICVRVCVTVSKQRGRLVHPNTRNCKFSVCQ